MANPASLVLDLAKGLLSRIKDVKRNHEECQFVQYEVEQTLKTLQGLEGRVFDCHTNDVLELVSDALINAKDEVDKCCNTSLVYSALHTDSFALSLNHAAEKLKHALSQVPLATLGMTADTQADLVDLSSQIRNSVFKDRARVAHHAMNVKDVVEKASKQTSQENIEIKNLIHLILLEQSWGITEIKKEIMLLRRDSNCLKREGNKEERKDREEDEFELKTIIEALSKSSTEVSKVENAMSGLENYLRCPISKEIMRDPVLLKESNIIYDRSSIEEWIGQGHGYDPQTNIKLVSGDLVSIPRLRVFCQIMLDESGDHSFTHCSSQEESKQQLEPGLYEGSANLFRGTSIVPTSQLLSLEPNGRVVGCTVYKGKDYGDQENNVVIGAGEWHGSAQELFFRDIHYHYHGGVENLVGDTHARLKWNRNVFARKDGVEEHASPLTYSQPCSLLEGPLHSTIMHTETDLNMATSQVTYKSKLVLSLEADSSVNGWTCLESSVQESKFVGHILEGRWDEAGFLNFFVNFTSENVPSKYVDAFQVAGIVNCDGMFPPMLSSIYRKATHADELQNVIRIPIPPSGSMTLEYPLLHEVSTPWHDMHSSPLKLFQTPRNFGFETSQAISSIQSKVECHRKLQLQCKKGGSRLHIASQNNHIDVLKELITKGADVNLQDTRGWTPLHIASEKNHMTMIKELIVNGATVDIKDKKGASSLYVASQKNHFDVVKELIASRANINLPDNIGRTPLHVASQNNCVNIVQALVAGGANINFQDVDGVSPLHMASQNNHLDIVKELLGKGANIDLQDNNGISALHIASKCGLVSVVQILLEHAASKEVKDMEGMAPYDVVCTYPYYGPFDKSTIKQLQVLLKK